MGTCTCSFCFATINRAHARIRSVAFRQVAYCAACWEEMNSVDVPSPRRSVETLADHGALTEA
jgi:hypothetical protein